MVKVWLAIPAEEVSRDEHVSFFIPAGNTLMLWGLESPSNVLKKRMKHVPFLISYT